MGNEQVRIDPTLIPDCDYDLACSVLYASISRALADPKTRQEYEAWKKEYIAQTARERGSNA